MSTAAHISEYAPAPATAVRPVWPLRAALALLVAVMFSLHLMGNLNAKFVIEDASPNAARVAAFDVGLADGAPAIVNLQGIEKPGDARQYKFSVSSASEVSVRYWLKLEYDGSMPLTFTIAKDTAAGAQVLSTTIAQLDAAIRANDMPFEATSTMAAKAPNTTAADTYVLTATWPAAENNLDYANNSVGELTVRAIAEQVD